MNKTLDFLPALSQFKAVTGQDTTIQTICRLIQRRQLRASKILGKWMCTQQDVMDYIERETEAALVGRIPKQVAAKSRSEAARCKAIERANKELEAAGL